MQAFNTRGGCPLRRNRNPFLFPFIVIRALRLLGPTAFGRRSAENIRLFVPQTMPWRCYCRVMSAVSDYRSEFSIPGRDRWRNVVRHH